jgi:flagellar biosynthesis protein FliR
MNGFLWPFVRISALLLAAPMFGARTVPVRVRISLALLLTLTVAPQLTVPDDVQPLSAAGALLVGREALIGTGMGFLLQMVFGAMAMAGEIIALSMGLAFASIVDPERGVSVPLVSQYFVVFSTLVFLALDGHLALLTLLVDSFRLLPPAAGGLGAGGFLSVAQWGGRMFEAAVFVALPASAALLVASMSMGLIARSAPQLNIFAVGFPMTLLLGLAALLLSVPLLAPQFESVLTAGLEQFQSVWSLWQ